MAAVGAALGVRCVRSACGIAQHPHACAPPPPPSRSPAPALPHRPGPRPGQFLDLSEGDVKQEIVGARQQLADCGIPQDAVVGVR